MQETTLDLAWNTWKSAKEELQRTSCREVEKQSL